MIRYRCQCTVVIPPSWFWPWGTWDPCTSDVTDVSDLRAVNFTTSCTDVDLPDPQWHTVHVHKDHIFMFEAMNVRHNVYEVVIDDS
jgi:hypothetical protein